MPSIRERQINDMGMSRAGEFILSVRDLLRAHRLVCMASRGPTRIDATIDATTRLVDAHDDDAASTRSAFAAVANIPSRTERAMLPGGHDHDHDQMTGIDRARQRVPSETPHFPTSRRGQPREPASSAFQAAKLSNLFRLNGLSSQGA